MKEKKTLILLKNPLIKYSLPLIEKKIINHDTRCFRFGLPTCEHVLGLPIGQHIQLSAKINDQIINRLYTPISNDDDHGYVDLPIKVYFKNTNTNFPAGGKMSQYLESMKIGDTIECRGPLGRLIYEGCGQFSINLKLKSPPVKYSVRKVVMLAGGTGITPMLQLIRAILKDSSDSTQVSLLFANKTEEDILLKNELDYAVKISGGQIKVWYTVETSVSEHWKYSTGYIDAEMIREYMYPPSPETMVLMCGPPAMIKLACKPNLDILGYDSNLRFCY